MQRGTVGWYPVWLSVRQEGARYVGGYTRTHRGEEEGWARIAPGIRIHVGFARRGGGGGGIRCGVKLRDEAARRVWRRCFGRVF